MRTTAPLTADYLFNMPPFDGYQFELVRGRLLVREGPIFKHGIIAGELLVSLAIYVNTHQLGRCVPEAAYHLERNPDTVRRPDVSFVSTARLPATLPERGYGDIIPDLAVEVRSPNDRTRYLAKKVEMYLQNGVRMVWLVEPKKRTVTVHEVGKDPIQLGEHDVLDGGDVVPGYRYEIAKLFKWPPAPPAPPGHA